MATKAEVTTPIKTNFLRTPSQRSFRSKVNPPIKPQPDNKAKVERELQRQEVTRDRERKLAEEKRRDEERQEERERIRERERVRRDRMTAARDQAAAKRQQQQHQQLSRTSSHGTNDSSPHGRDESDEDYDPSTYNVSASPSKQASQKVANGRYRTTISINGGEDPNVEINQGANRPPVSRTTSKKTPKPPATASSTGPKERKSLFASKPRDDLVPCSNCGRCFAEDRISKHQEICIKTSMKKRKTFDSTKKRVAGTEAEVFVKKAAKNKTKEKPAKKSDWRKKREEFINALRAAKEAQRYVAAGGKISDLPPPPPMDTSDYIQCPHCNRKFNEAAADRHIPKCKNIKSNKR